jgi:hypothetical protein
VHSHLALYRHELGDLAQEPVIHPASSVDCVNGDPETESLGDPQEIIRGAQAQGLAYPLLVD